MRWKQIVYHCRRRGYYQEAQNLEQSEKDVIVGHIASGRNEKFDKMNSWDMISTGDVLMIPDRKCEGKGKPSKVRSFRTLLR